MKLRFFLKKAVIIFYVGAQFGEKENKLYFVGAVCQ